MARIQTIAIFLLVARVVSVVFIAYVLRLQWRLFGTKIDFSLVPNLTKYARRRIYLARKVLFTLSCVIMAGNMVPVLIDTLTIVSDNAVGRSPNVPPISIAYAFSNALTAMFSSIMIYTLYRLAGLGTHDTK